MFSNLIFIQSEVTLLAYYGLTNGRGVTKRYISRICLLLTIHII
ncbi:hypothetical protein IFVP136_C280138 [Vibrio parahaemolyticus]